MSIQDLKVQLKVEGYRKPKISILTPSIRTIDEYAAIPKSK